MVKEIYWYTPIIRKIYFAEKEIIEIEKREQEREYKKIMNRPLRKLSDDSYHSNLIKGLKKLLT